MAIHSFLKAERGDPDWQFSPEDYYGKEFKILEAAMVELDDGKTDFVVLRQNPTEKELLAKHLKIFVRSDAILDMTIVNDVDPKLQQVFLYDVHLKPGATLNLGIFAKDGKLNKHIIQVYQEEGSLFSAYGLIFNNCAGDTEVITKVVHQGPGSTSNQLFFALAGEDSQTVYQGITIVEPEAADCQIGVESSNLVIGSKGRCYAKPETYINADNVISGVNTDNNTISAEKIDYLESRGIPTKEARSMIISGFRDQVINLIVRDNVKQGAFDAERYF